MNRRARFSELWKWISFYSEVFDCRPMAYAQDRFPPFPLLTANAFDVKCRKRSAWYTVVRIAECQGERGRRRRKQGEEGDFRVWVREFMEIYFSAMRVLVGAYFYTFLYNHEYYWFFKIVKLTFDYARLITGQIERYNRFINILYRIYISE